MSTKTKIVTGAVDTWATNSPAAAATKNFAATPGLRIAGSSAYAYVFVTIPVPRGATVESAYLDFGTSGSWGGAAETIRVRRIAQRYTNTRLTWNNKPSVGTLEATAAVTPSGDNALIRVDVTTLVQQVADGAGGAYYGFRVAKDGATVRALRSAQATSGRRPQLVVTWSEAPARPTTLSPSGGQAVAVARPVLSADYTDVSGTGELAAVRVQIAATSTGFASPTFDSGEVPATGAVARLDLAATAYAGLAEGGVAYWRVQVKDSSGLWSDWSAVEDFTRTAKGTVTIDSPTAVDPTLTDYTPPILWSLSTAQAKWRVIVTRTDTDAEVFDSEERAGADQSVTVADSRGRAVLTTGVPYRVEVRAWDTVDRVAQPGDPVYAVASRDFTVAAGASAAPTALVGVGALTAEGPAAVLTWERTSAPDGFTVLRDGTPIAANLDPADLFVSGTTYTYTDRATRPNLDQTYAVAAVVNGVASPTVSTVVKVKVGGAWLLDPATPSRRLFVAGTSGSKWELGEEAETLIPVGAEEVVRVTSGLRGYEGTIAGVLVAEHGRTLQQWVDDALAIRARPGRTFVLVMGTEAIEVAVGNVQVRPTGDSSPGMRPVSFDFWQTSPQRVPVVL